ncbi:glycosyltransferase [Pontibacter liquoris]|uniref:glycosyltransferase n=1 Tax=Pontibacter liquoris TaxID=2905677 RepID=UPI00210495A8|nr:glycosyltransferase [Pontibacter liquoris]
MKYWLLTTEYPPFYGGGISTYCLNTAKMMSREGHDVSIFINDSSVSDIVTEITDDGRVIRFNPNRCKSAAFLGHVTNISYEFAFVLKQFVEDEGKPDMIEAQEYQGIAYYILQFKHLQYDWCKNIPVIITMHSPAFLYLEYNHVPLFKYPNYWIGEMERFCIQAADVVVSPSQFLISEVEKRFKYNHSDFFVVPNPFEFKDINQKKSITPKQEDIAFFGKLSAQKGTFLLLHYFARLWEKGFCEPLCLIGGQDIVYHPEGRTMGDVVRRKYKVYIDRGLLRLENQVSPAEIEDRLSRAKVVIVPSAVDNLPYVVLEMMSLGLVVLVSKQGGQAEIVANGINGFIFDHDEADSFEVQLKKILDLTAEQRADISANAVLRIASTYNFKTIYNQKIKAIQTAIERAHILKPFPFIRQQEPTVVVTPISSNDILSVVVPYFNMGKYIDDTIDSIKNSSVVRKQIIIVNDGSTDEASLAKLLPYRSDPSINVIDVPNGGLGSARNIGAERAEGEYLAFLDADDKVDPKYFEKSIKVLRQHRNVHFIGAWTQYFEGSNKIWPTFSPEPPLILYHNLINSSALVYRRSSFLAAGANDQLMPFQGLEDYDSVISLIGKGFKGVVLPEILFNYRVRKDSMIRGISNEKKLILLEYTCKKHKEFYSTFAIELFNLVNANGSGTVLDNPTRDYQLSAKFPFNSYLSREVISFIKRNKHLKRIAYRAYSALNK